MAITDKLKAIANAIRTKTGKTEVMCLDDMPVEIEGIEGSENCYIYNSEFVLTGNRESIGSAEFFNKNIVGVLAELYLPNLLSVEGIGFYGNNNITKLVLPKANSIKNNAFEKCGKLEYVHLESLEVISGSVFISCSSLKTVKLDMCKDIWEGAFAKTSLEELILPRNTVVVLHQINAFSTTPIESGTGYVYVPKALVEQYKVATNWSNFASQFRAIEDYPEICGE